jgi:Zn-dependent peptidase ImmA (M78 family)
MSHDYKVAPKRRIDIEHYACAWRDALGVKHSCQAPDIIAILENDIPKLFTDFTLLVKDDQVMDGAEGYTEFEPTPSIVLSNSSYMSAGNHKGRGRWTAAHELGHLVLHKSAVPFERAIGAYTKIKQLAIFESAEWQANAFAAGFLMPEHLVRDFTDPGEIADFFSVSRQAAENRIKTLGLVSKRVIAPQVLETIQQIERRR